MHNLRNAVLIAAGTAALLLCAVPGRAEAS